MQSIRQRGESASDGNARLIRWIVRGYFFAALGLVLVKTVVPIPSLERARWPEPLLIIAATISILHSLTGLVPFQNAILAAVCIGLVGGFAQLIQPAKGFWLGPFFVAQDWGLNLLILPGAISIAWILSLLSSRGVAQLILRPWRKSSAFGFWQLGLATALALPFHLGLELFGSQGKGYWQWQSEVSSGGLSSSPLAHFAAWWVIALIALVSATPALLKKKPVEPPPAWHPLVVWASLILLYTTGFARQQWPAAIGCSVVVIAALALAIRGARFQE